MWDLAFQVLARRFPGLFMHPLALLADPAQAGDGVGPQHLVAGVGRRDQGHAAQRRVHAQVDVFDPAPLQADGDVAQLDDLSGRCGLGCGHQHQ
jgi:hypothetical protein